jgi:hypothetical protein
MVKLQERVRFLVVRGALPGTSEVIVQCIGYPVPNTRGSTVDEAMEKMCAVLLVHLMGKRTGDNYYIEKSSHG